MSTIGRWEEHIAGAKPFGISKRMVYEAWKRVKANGGAPGIDGQTIEQFEAKLSNNLYKVWNRMSSGSYHPKPVRLHSIPKKDGRQRVLGIPAVIDRVAQMVVVRYLEPLVESSFHPDSYAYRTGRSALDAVGTARKRCWWYDWVIDLDIKSFFDSIDHELLMRAVRRHTQEKWVLLYIERWLKAPGQDKRGVLVERDRGTPQGGVASPILANLFLHYVFDLWMRKHFGTVPFERYADDIIVHCRSEKQAQFVLEGIRRRLRQCGLRLHPDKTKIIFCKDGQRRGNYPHTKFDFLSYQFRTRFVRNSTNGQYFVGFTPGISPQSRAELNHAIREWDLVKRVPLSLQELAKSINPVVRGWIQYFAAYNRSALSPVLRQVELSVSRWAMRKYKRLHRRRVESLRWLARLRKREPTLFAHWYALG